MESNRDKFFWYKWREKCFDTDNGDDHVLLLDKELIVRGIYDLNDLDEYDRLNVEIDIINRYER